MGYRTRCLWFGGIAVVLCWIGAAIPSRADTDAEAVPDAGPADTASSTAEGDADPIAEDGESATTVESADTDTGAARGDTSPPAQPEGPDSAQQPPEDRRETARRLFDEGAAAFENGEYASAAALFAQAYDVMPHPAVLKSIAECRLQLGDVTGALTLLRRVAKDPKYGDRDAVAKRIAEIERESVRVEVTSTPAEASVRIDGTAIDARTPTVVWLPPGAHEIALSTPGFEDFVQRVDGTAGDAITIEAALVAAASVQDTADSRVESAVPDHADAQVRIPQAGGADVVTPPRAFWALSVAAGSGVIAGTVFGTMALRDEKSYRDTFDDATRTSGRRAAVLADISFGIAAASAVAAVIVLIRHRGKRGEPERTAAMQVRPLLAPAALGAHVSF